MSDNTEPINPNDPDIQESRAKLLHDLADVSNPDTRSLIRELFADFCKSKEAETAKPAPSPDGMQAELKDAVSAVLRKYGIRDAECTIGISYNSSKNKPAEAESDTAKKSEETASESTAESTATEEQETTPPPERSKKDIALDNIIDWVKKLTPVPCNGIHCDDGCPISIKIGDRVICLKYSIVQNIQTLMKERGIYD